jgi:hypothetical protein
VRGLPAIRQPTDQRLCTAREEIQDALFTHFSKLAKPINGARTGEYRTTPRNYPWSKAKLVKDHFILHADTDPQHHSLLPSMADSNTFSTCVRYLGSNTAPGPHLAVAAPCKQTP